jgi:hypothetical protein
MARTKVDPDVVAAIAGQLDSRASGCPGGRLKELVHPARRREHDRRYVARAHLARIHRCGAVIEF